MKARKEGTSGMKKLLASVTVAGLFVAGGASAAWAADPGGSAGSGSGQPTGAQQRGHHRRGARLAIETAAATIGVTPQDLRSQVRGGKTVAQVATEHGVDPASVVNAVVTALTQRIDEAAAQGKIDANRAEQAKQKLPDVANRLVNETKQRRGFRILKDAAKAAAKEIGVSDSDLKQARKDGKSIAQVAKDHGKSVDDVVNAIVKAATTDIDQAVKDGKLDAKKADEIKQKLPDRVKQLVNREPRAKSSATPGTQ
jgi:ribosomal protein S20